MFSIISFKKNHKEKQFFKNKSFPCCIFCARITLYTSIIYLSVCDKTKVLNNCKCCELHCITTGPFNNSIIDVIVMLISPNFNYFTINTYVILFKITEIITWNFIKTR